MPYVVRPTEVFSIGWCWNWNWANVSVFSKSELPVGSALCVSTFLRLWVRLRNNRFVHKLIMEITGASPVS